MSEMLCPICRVPQDLLKSHLRGYPTRERLFEHCRIITCNHCKSGWVYNPPSEESLRKYYDAGLHGASALLGKLEKPALTLERCQSKSRWEFIRNALGENGSAIFGRPVSVCDIGAGYGTTLEVGSHLGFKIDFVAYESSRGLRKRITRLGGKAFDDFFSEKGNVLKGERPHSFDLVWASHILEHYPDPDILLGRTRALLGPNGFGFIEVPFLDNEFKRDLAPHLLFFTKEGLESALVRNGFEVLQLRSAGPLRLKLKEELAVGEPAGLKARLKAMLPTPVATVGSVVYHTVRSVAAPRAADVHEDLQNRRVIEQWQLETYDGERNWIRAVFTNKTVV